MALKNNGKIGVDWKRKVKTEYLQICKQKRHKRADEAKMAWHQNRFVLHLFNGIHFKIVAEQ